MIAVLNRGIGSVQAVCNALSYIDLEHKIVDRVCASNDLLIIPGTGSFDEFLETMGEENKYAVKHHVATGKPLIGICVGMQILFQGSEEGVGSGLGVFDGLVRKMHASKSFPVPHVGWRTIRWIEDGSDAVENKYYFVHSYAAPVTSYSRANYCYNDLEYSAVTRKENCMGVQFHPEKSGYKGLQFLKKIIEEVYV